MSASLLQALAGRPADRDWEAGRRGRARGGVGLQTRSATAAGPGLADSVPLSDQLGWQPGGCQAARAIATVPVPVSA